MKARFALEGAYFRSKRGGETIKPKQDVFSQGARFTQAVAKLELSTERALGKPAIATCSPKRKRNRQRENRTARIALLVDAAQNPTQTQSDFSGLKNSPGATDAPQKQSFPLIHQG